MYLILSILKITSKTRRTQLLVCDLGERNSLSVLLRPLRQITWLCFPGASGNKRRVLLACIILTWQNLVIEKCWNASPKLYLDACKNNWDMSKRLSATKKKKKKSHETIETFLDSLHSTYCKPAYEYFHWLLNMEQIIATENPNTQIL